MSDLNNLLIINSIKAAKENTSAARKLETEKRLSLLNDDFKQLIEAELSNQFTPETAKSIKQMIDDSNNVFKRIINEISMVYKSGANRKAINVETKEEDQRYAEIISKIQMDSLMASANELTNACNEIFIKITPRNGRVEIDLMTPDYLDVVQQKDDPTKMASSIHCNTFVDSSGVEDIEYVYWDIYGNHIVYDSNMVPIKREENPENVNPYNDPENSGKKVIPIIPIHRKLNTNSIFDNTSGTDLYSLAIQTGVLLTYFNYLLKMNSFKQLAMMGWDEESIKMLTNILDPSYPLVTKNENAKAEVLDYQGNIDLFFQAINNKIISVASNYGISADQLKMSVSAQSGFSLEMKRMGLEEVRTKQIKLWRWYEKEIFNMIRIVNNYHYPDNPISDKAEFQIDFIEPSTPKDDAAIRENWKFDMSIGAKSVLDYVQFINPDLDTEDKALEAIQKNMAINRKASMDNGIDLESIFSSIGNKISAASTQGDGTI